MTDVEDALRTVLEERAEDVEWNPALVTRAVADGTARRSVPPATVWLAAAAAAVLVVGAVSMATGGGSGGPATRSETTAPSASGPQVGTAGGGPRWRSCAEAFGVGALQFTASGNGGLVSPLPPPPTTSYVAPPVVTPSDAQVPSSAPFPIRTSGSGPVQQPETSAASAPPTDVVVPTPASPQGAAESEAWSQLDQVLDEERFAGFSPGPQAGTLTIHVVRGVDEAGAEALVASCAHEGLTYRTDLVRYSGLELSAVSVQAAEVLSASGGAAFTSAWVDPARNRTTVTVTGDLTAAQRSALAERFADRVAVWMQDSGTWWQPGS